jgi:hypothetical protein
LWENDHTAAQQIFCIALDEPVGNENHKLFDKSAVPSKKTVTAIFLSIDFFTFLHQ